MGGTLNTIDMLRKQFQEASEKEWAAKQVLDAATKAVQKSKDAEERAFDIWLQAERNRVELKVRLDMEGGDGK